MWAYAERLGIPELWSEDFQHGRMYGTVQVIDPFAQRESAVDPGEPDSS
jgi:predicted nucleic acid-binding protein